MPANVSLQTSVGLAIILAMLALGTWRWQGRVAHLQQHDEASASESWEHVQHDYPMVPDAPEASTLSGELAEKVVQANPFSPKRRFVPSATGGGTENGGRAIEPATPVFTYKGRINVGQRQRAIMEETESGKTYFLEVGQEVAGFKVLDIAENRVVLSDLQTNEEVVVSLISPEGR